MDTLGGRHTPGLGIGRRGDQRSRPRPLPPPAPPLTLRKQLAAGRPSRLHTEPRSSPGRLPLPPSLSPSPCPSSTAADTLRRRGSPERGAHGHQRRAAAASPRAPGRAVRTIQAHARAPPRDPAKAISHQPAPAPRGIPRPRARMNRTGEEQSRNSTS